MEKTKLWEVLKDKYGEDYLSYFTIFDINKDDINNVFDSLLSVNDKIYDYRNFIIKKIKEKYIFFTENVFDNGHFKKTNNKDEINNNTAFFNSLISLSLRILACQYNHIEDNEEYLNISRINIPKVSEEVTNVFNYKESLLLYYTSLYKWLLTLINFNHNKTLDYFSKVDSFIMIALQKIKFYKSFFILIWIYGIIQKAILAHEYCKSLSNNENDYNINNIFNLSTLSPVSVLKISSYNHISQNLAIKNAMENNKNKLLKNNFEKLIIKKLKERDLLAFDFKEYFTIMEKVESSFSFYYSFESNKYLDSLCNVLFYSDSYENNLNTIKEVLDIHIYNKMKNKIYTQLISTNYDVDFFKGVIFSHSLLGHKKTLFSYPELIEMNIRLEKKELFTILNDEFQINSIVKETLKEVIWNYFSSLKFNNPNYIIKDISGIKLKNQKKEENIGEAEKFDLAFIVKSTNKLYLIKFLRVKNYKNLMSNFLNDIYFGNKFDEFTSRKVTGFYEIYQKSWHRLKKHLGYKDIEQTEFVVITDEEPNYIISKKVDGKVIHIIKYDDVDYFFRSYIFKEINILE
ncbi:hypothetical protein SCORR_v1c02870 [Spiroplasma corruscae]|uniref:Uncharacterized protein n=1 Tax=Spiroplasma corruscae TaxID=216934 RepID=A0A222ENQ0_9MOLU|nr:hypothetical protein [Spiroplasma corruscae]ASP28061.1 hypothetical protein SCORR_v1c02870 [Spiroplasma corruscae]